MKNKVLAGLFLLSVFCGKGQNASFSVSQPDKCVPSTVIFTNTSSVGYTDITWDWGDPNDPNPYKGTNNPVSHPFTQPGKYVITLTLVYPSGTSVYKDSIMVYALPNFSFKKLNDSICPNGNISFSTSLVYPASSSGVKSYYWNFGDGSNDTVANPTHTFPNYANVSTRYRISLTIIDTNGCTKQVDSNNYVYVKNKPVAQFAMNNSTTNLTLCFISGATSAAVNFANQTTGAVSYLWDFDDGSTSTQVNPTHNFAYSSTPYEVTLTATNAEGCTDVYTRTISPLAYSASYTLSDTTLCNVPDSKIEVRGTDFGSSFRWVWGDGYEDFTGISSMEHIYKTQANYRFIVEATHPRGCIARDTVIIHAYARQNPVHDGRYFLRNRIDVDWTRCDTTVPVTFINTTSYDLFDDFGLGSITWIFEDATIVGGDTISHLFPYYGEHPFTAIITTPYGCVLDSIWQDSIFLDEPWLLAVHRILGIQKRVIDTNNQVYIDNYGSCGWWDSLQNFHCRDIYFVNPEQSLLTDTISVFHTRAYARVSGMGCIPVTGTIHSYDCDMNVDTCIPFIRSAAPIADAVIYWDFYGNITDTSHLALPSPPDSIIWEVNESHIYPDTGVFQVAMVVTNIEGCVDTILLGKTVAGIELAGTFTYDYTEQCRGDYFKMDTWFWITFILNGDTTLEPEQFFVIDQWGDTSEFNFNPLRISPKDTGYWGVEVIPIWHGCKGIGDKKDSILYACPPVAFFHYENIDPVGQFTYFGDSIVRFCGCPATIGFKDSSFASQWQEWFFGDAALLSQQSTDTGDVTQFTYDCSNPFIHQNSFFPGIIVTMIAHNADSVDKNSPTYNRCGYCADSIQRIFYISDAEMNFVADKYVICTNDSILFCDSTLLNNGEFISWNFMVDSAANMNYPFLEYSIGETFFYKSFLQDPILPFPALPPLPSYDYPELNTGTFGCGTLLFTQPNVYRLVLQDVDALHCVRYDTIRVTINPQSVPKYVSGTDNSHFNYLSDTLCFNNPDTLYVRDSSYTAYPFEHVKVTDWQWTAFGDTFRTQNPAIPAKAIGEQSIELTITNDVGCKSTVIDTFIVREAYAQFQTSSKSYCNNTYIYFSNRSGVYPLLDNRDANMTCTWDWGDGTPPEIQTITNWQSPIPTIGHRYNLPKSAGDLVEITLTVKVDGMDCEAVFKDTLYIGSFQAGFTSDGNYFPCPGNEGRTVAFSDTTNGNVIYYIWDFGDALSGSSNRVEGPNEKNVIHKYSKSGTYNVTLIVEDNLGCWDTLLKGEYIFIDGPWGDFSYAPLSGCLPLEVLFFPEAGNTDTVVVNPNLSIILSHGGIYVDSAISYTYTQTGAFLPYFYLIKWTTDINGNPERCVLEWQGEDTIWVIDIQPDFDTDSLYCIGVSASFEDKSIVVPSSQQIDSVYWNFDNGNTATTFTAATQYDSAGVYTVEMTVYAKNCSKSVQHPINVMPFPELVFHPDSAAACSNLEVVFYTDTLTDLENSRILTYDWTFIDGEKYTGNPISRSFSQTGIYPYDVLLTFTPANCVKLYNDSIHVDVFIVPTAEFEPTPPAVRMGDAIHFIDKSQKGDGDIVSWQWNFGEDAYSQEQSPSHTYKTLSGYVTVYLVIEDANGCMGNIEHEVLILENLRFPNIFTPQSISPDGQPYVFRPLREEGYFKEFRITIYNRHGMLVWSQSCKEPNCPDYQNNAFWWSGKNLLGEYVSDGVYYWVAYAIPMSETQTFILNGSVTVISEKK